MVCHTGLLTACEQDQDGKLVHLVGFIIRSNFRVSRCHHRGVFSASNRSRRMNFNGWSTQGLYFPHSHVTFFVVLYTSLVLMFIYGRHKSTVTKLLKLQIHCIKSRNISSFVPLNMNHIEKHFKLKLQILMSYLLYFACKFCCTLYRCWGNSWVLIWVSCKMAYV